MPSRRHDSLHAHLRAATVDAHQFIDASFSAFDLQSRLGYRRFLEASAAALLPLEKALTVSGIANLVTDWDERMRSDAIAADLVVLHGTNAALPMQRRFTEAEMLGVAYVLEGSRLGARYLMKRVTASPDPVVATTTSYLAHGAGLPLWPRFLTLLNAVKLSARDTELAVDGAVFAFALFAEGARRS